MLIHIYLNFAIVSGSCYHFISRINYVTVFNSKLYKLIQTNQLKSSILDHLPLGNLIIYHEDYLPPIPGVCLFDLRNMIWFENELMNNTSGLNRYLSYAGFGDPITPDPGKDKFFL